MGPLSGCTRDVGYCITTLDLRTESCELVCLSSCVEWVYPGFLPLIHLTGLISVVACLYMYIPFLVPYLTATSPT